MKQKLVLVGGDTLALLFFSWLGRTSHGETDIAGIFSTAFPFWLGWMCAGWVLGGYRPESQKTVGSALRTTVRVWAVGIPLGLLIRALWLRRSIPLSFAAITLTTTLLIMSLWRSSWAYLNRRRDVQRGA